MTQTTCYRCKGKGSLPVTVDPPTHTCGVCKGEGTLYEDTHCIPTGEPPDHPVEGLARGNDLKECAERLQSKLDRYP